MISDSNSHKKDGFAVVYVALLIASITTTFAFIYAQAGIQAAHTVRAVEQRQLIDATMISCIELALLEIKNNPTDEIDGNFSFLGGECEYEVLGTIPAKTLTTTVTINEIELTRTTIINSTNPKIELND